MPGKYETSAASGDKMSIKQAILGSKTSLLLFSIFPYGFFKLFSPHRYPHKPMLIFPSNVSV